MLHKAYSRVVDVMRTGKRILGTYYRVAFYGVVRSLMLCPYIPLLHYAVE